MDELAIKCRALCTAQHVTNASLQKYTSIQAFLISPNCVSAMTHLLEQALNAVRELPDADQNAIAALILDELADEKRWDAAFAQSQDTLAQMAAKAGDDVASGRVCSGGFDEL